MSERRLTGRRAIVTGGGSGIGRAVVERFVAEGAEVVVADRSGQRATETVEALGPLAGRAIAVKADVTQDQDAARMVAAAVAAFGGLDVLVNVAGIVLPGDLDHATEQDFDRTFSVNVKGGFLCSKHALPELRRAGGGSILFTASTTGVEGTPGQLLYGASKAAILNMTRSMALDHGPEHIRVNCVCPGPTRTAPMAAFLAASGLETRDLVGRVPLGERMAEPDEVAAAFCFLASDDAAFVTGHALVVDGGLLAGGHRPRGSA